MRRFSAILRETLFEVLSNKVLIGFFVIAGLGLLAMIIAINMPETSAKIARLQPTPDFPDTAALETFVREWFSISVGFFFYNSFLIVATIITAGLVPSMMRKGVIDLYLSKPISRTQLLFGKVLGGLIIVLACIIFFVGGVWLIFGVKTGVWDTAPLASMFPIMVSFIGMYGILVFIGVTSESPFLGIIIVFLLAGLVSAMLANRETTLYGLVPGDIGRTVIDLLYVIMPQTSESAEIAGDIMYGKTVTNFFPMIQATFNGLIFFSLAAISFRRKEF